MEKAPVANVATIIAFAGCTGFVRSLDFSIVSYCYQYRFQFYLFFAGKNRSRWGKLVLMTPSKTRGIKGGPKRTPPNLGDAWQTKTAYEVEEIKFCLKYL